MSAANKSAETFMAACRNGTATAENIDDYIDSWHGSNPAHPQAGQGLPLHEFLGLSKDEYARWLSDSSALTAIIAEHLASQDLLLPVFVPEKIVDRMAHKQTVEQRGTPFAHVPFSDLDIE